MAQAAVPLDASHLPDGPVGPRVYRVLGRNPGPMTLQGTNTYLVGIGPVRLLIDAGEGRPEYTAALERAIEATGCSRVEHVLVTHHHYDHTGGLHALLGGQSDRLRSVFQGAKVWKLLLHSESHLDKSAACCPESPTQPRAASSRELLHLKLEGHAEESHLNRLVDTQGLSFSPAHDGQSWSVEGATVRAVHTPGHTDDHLSFFLEEESTAFSGDCVLGSGTAQFRNLHTYLGSLGRLIALNPSRLYPAHGPVVEDAVQRLQQYIAHRRQREEQILRALAEGPRALTAEELVAAVYTDLKPALVRAAAGNVLLHLGKLLAEGRVACSDPAASEPSGPADLLLARWAPAIPKPEPADQEARAAL